MAHAYFHYIQNVLWPNYYRNLANGILGNQAVWEGLASWLSCVWCCLVSLSNRFKSSSKIFYWPFQGGTSLWIFYVFSVLCLLCLCSRLFICALWSPAGKGLTSWLSFVVCNCEFDHCLTGLSPPVKYFTDRSKAVLLCGSFMFFLSCVCYVFVHVCSFVPCGHLLGKGWPLGSRLWCVTVSLLFSPWYPGSGVVLDCIDPWSLHPYLLLTYFVHSSGYWFKRKTQNSQMFYQALALRGISSQYHHRNQCYTYRQCLERVIALIKVRVIILFAMLQFIQSSPKNRISFTCNVII